MPEMSKEERNKTLARRYYAELMSGGDLSFVDKYMAPEFEFSNPTHVDPYKGQEFKNLVTMLRGAFPDVKFTVEHLLAQGDTVVGHWTARGTHTGKPLETLKGDIPAKGNPFVIDGMSWLRFNDEGKFVEARINEDTLGLLLQIGAIPDCAPASRTSSSPSSARSRRATRPPRAGSSRGPTTGRSSGCPRLVTASKTRAWISSFSRVARSPRSG